MGLELSIQTQARFTKGHEFSTPQARGHEFSIETLARISMGHEFSIKIATKISLDDAGLALGHK